MKKWTNGFSSQNLWFSRSGVGPRICVSIQSQVTLLLLLAQGQPHFDKHVPPSLFAPTSVSLFHGFSVITHHHLTPSMPSTPSSPGLLLPPPFCTPANCHSWVSSQTMGNLNFLKTEIQVIQEETSVCSPLSHSSQQGTVVAGDLGQHGLARSQGSSRLTEPPGASAARPGIHVMMDEVCFPVPWETGGGGVTQKAASNHKSSFKEPSQQKF